MTLRDAAAFLDGLVNLERTRFDPSERCDLSRIEALLARVDHPERELSVLHIAGSKGKGSTALWSEALLGALGETVGCFTSPHLERWTERFRIGGSEVGEVSLVRVLDQLRPHVEDLCACGRETAPSFFDVTTAAALLLFRAAGVDRAILEVGLGGRLDSTNVVIPAVACITSIEREHTERLGKTLGAIAREKAGVIKPGRPVVVGNLCKDAMFEIRERARICGSRTVVCGEDFTVSARRDECGNTMMEYASAGMVFAVPLATRSPKQALNAALALTCVGELGGYSAEELISAAGRVFPNVKLPGRMECVSERPWVVVDGAHTEASIAVLLEGLAGIARKCTRFVVSISSDKRIESLLPPLLEVADEVTVTRANAERSVEAHVLAEVIRQLHPGLFVRVESDPRRAVAGALARCSDEDLLCLTGSVYLAGIGRSVLRELGLLGSSNRASV